MDKQKSLVSMLELDPRIPARNGTICGEERRKLLLARVDIDRSNCANSCLVDSSNTSTFWGNFDKIPASTISALFLKKKKTYFTLENPEKCLNFQIRLTSNPNVKAQLVNYSIGDTKIKGRYK